MTSPTEAELVGTIEYLPYNIQFASLLKEQGMTYHQM